MIIITARRPRLSFASLVSCVTTACAFFLVMGFVNRPYQEAMSNPSDISHTVKNGGQRVDYLQQWGWEVGETPLATQILRIPTTLDSSYTHYIAMQLAQGFPSLEEFSGEEVIQYTYEIVNYPTGETGVQVNLLCHDSQVIAGEVLSPEINGFIHGLSFPQ